MAAFYAGLERAGYFPKAWPQKRDPEGAGSVGKPSGQGPGFRPAAQAVRISPSHRISEHPGMENARRVCPKRINGNCIMANKDNNILITMSFSHCGPTGLACFNFQVVFHPQPPPFATG